MTTAVVAAAGLGERLGAARPKALVALGGRPMIAWCLIAMQRSAAVRAAVIAAPEGQEDELRAAAHASAPALELDVITGGRTRSESVALALAAAADASTALVHDAARPLVTPELIDRCIGQLERWGCDGVVAAARAVDTIKEADAGGRVIATLERSSLWAVQTPQVFRASSLRAALAGASLARAYDDAQLVEAAGGDVRVVEAPRQNLKVTTEQDLRLAELLLRERAAREPSR
jgi:2-C-methyl-D-erythritol 4-phosphate cytidylyltransferase